MSFIQGITTEGNEFTLRPDAIECIKEFDEGTGLANSVGVIITMKSGQWFRTTTYDMAGIKEAIGI